MALLLRLFGSVVVALTFAVSLIAEPDATVVFTFTTKVKFAVALTAKVAMVQAEAVHVHPAGPLSDINVVFAGTVSFRVMVFAGAGPLLVTVCE